MEVGADAARSASAGVRMAIKAKGIFMKTLTVAYGAFIQFMVPVVSQAMNLIVQFATIAADHLFSVVSRSADSTARVPMDPGDALPVLAQLDESADEQLESPEVQALITDMTVHMEMVNEHIQLGNLHEASALAVTYLSCAPPGLSLGKFWLLFAEVELSIGNPEGAHQALTSASFYMESGPADSELLCKKEAIRSQVEKAELVESTVVAIRLWRTQGLAIERLQIVFRNCKQHTYGMHVVGDCDSEQLLEDDNYICGLETDEEGILMAVICKSPAQKPSTSPNRRSIVNSGREIVHLVCGPTCSKGLRITGYYDRARERNASEHTELVFTPLTGSHVPLPMQGGRASEHVSKVFLRELWHRCSHAYDDGKLMDMLHPKEHIGIACRNTLLLQGPGNDNAHRYDVHRLDQHGGAICIAICGTAMCKPGGNEGLAAWGLQNVETDLNIAREMHRVPSDTAHATQEAGNVHSGFRAAFQDIWQSLWPSLEKQVGSHREMTSIHLVGHSLGGALAILVALELSALRFQEVFVHVWGCPHVGDHMFAEFYRSRPYNLNGNTVRYVNRLDPIPRILALARAISAPWEHVGLEKPLDSYMKVVSGCFKQVSSQLERVDVSSVMRAVALDGSILEAATSGAPHRLGFARQNLSAAAVEALQSHFVETYDQSMRAAHFDNAFQRWQQAGRQAMTIASAGQALWKHRRGLRSLIQGPNPVAPSHDCSQAVVWPMLGMAPDTKSTLSLPAPSDSVVTRGLVLTLPSSSGTSVQLPIVPMGQTAHSVVSIRSAPCNEIIRPTGIVNVGEASISSLQAAGNGVGMAGAGVLMPMFAGLLAVQMRTAQLATQAVESIKEVDTHVIALHSNFDRFRTFAQQALEDIQDDLVSSPSRKLRSELEGHCEHIKSALKTLHVCKSPTATVRNVERLITHLDQVKNIIFRMLVFCREALNEWLSEPMIPNTSRSRRLPSIQLLQECVGSALLAFKEEFLARVALCSIRPELDMEAECQQRFEEMRIDEIAYWPARDMPNCAWPVSAVEWRQHALLQSSARFGDIVGAFIWICGERSDLEKECESLALLFGDIYHLQCEPLTTSRTSRGPASDGELTVLSALGLILQKAHEGMEAGQTRTCISLMRMAVIMQPRLAIEWRNKQLRDLCRDGDLVGIVVQLSHFADRWQHMQSAFYEACLHGHQTIAKFLANVPGTNVEISAQMENGTTPLGAAVHVCHSDLVRWLLAEFWCLTGSEGSASELPGILQDSNVVPRNTPTVIAIVGHCLAHKFPQRVKLESCRALQQQLREHQWHGMFDSSAAAETLGRTHSFRKNIQDMLCARVIEALLDVVQGRQADHELRTCALTVLCCIFSVGLGCSRGFSLKSHIEPGADFKQSREAARHIGEIQRADELFWHCRFKEAGPLYESIFHSLTNLLSESTANLLSENTWFPSIEELREHSILLGALCGNDVEVDLPDHHSFILLTKLRRPGGASLRDLLRKHSRHSIELRHNACDPLLYLATQQLSNPCQKDASESSGLEVLLKTYMQALLDTDAIQSDIGRALSLISRTHPAVLRQTFICGGRFRSCLRSAREPMGQDAVLEAIVHFLWACISPGTNELCLQVLQLHMERASSKAGATEVPTLCTRLVHSGIILAATETMKRAKLLSSMSEWPRMPNVPSNWHWWLEAAMQQETTRLDADQAALVEYQKAFAHWRSCSGKTGKFGKYENPPKDPADARREANAKHSKFQTDCCILMRWVYQGLPQTRKDIKSQAEQLLADREECDNCQLRNAIKSCQKKHQKDERFMLESTALLKQMDS